MDLSTASVIGDWCDRGNLNLFACALSGVVKETLPMIRRLYVEKSPEHALPAHDLLAEIRDCLAMPQLRGLRVLMRYDVEGLDDSLWETARDTIFSEPPLDIVHEGENPWSEEEWILAVEFLPGQYDQRADSAEQCLRLLGAVNPRVHAVRVYAWDGVRDADLKQRIRAYLVNPVDSREADSAMPETLRRECPEPQPVRRIADFAVLDDDGLAGLHRQLGLAMSMEDLRFCQAHFRDEEERAPSITELKLLDTYWSDHCRHTTFLTGIESVEFDEDPATVPVCQAWRDYQSLREETGTDPEQRPVCLMDIALMGMRALRRRGCLENLEISEEVNAASIVVPVEVNGVTEEWLVMFKNETHNHPTEIEPFGGAATCLGGAIRDPLSGRSFVYQAMRVTGAADPRVPVSDTLEGKLPQRIISRNAAHGYSSYGNQIGLATGMVHEFHHPGYLAKRMEIGAVIAAAPRSQVVRGTPAPGDVIVLVGGATGRDGIGGATGSSKAHDSSALENSAEVQKGDAPEERKLQRLFRDADVSRMIKRCNDFGAGGVSVAIGELAGGLEIDLDAVPLKYDGLDGTEIALSESQERMAVVLDPADVERFISAAAVENLNAVAVAVVTDSGRLRMKWRGDQIVDISRQFLDTNGVRQKTVVRVTAPQSKLNPLLPEEVPAADLAGYWTGMMRELNVCSQKGLVEMFDSTVGANSVLHPFGGTFRATPAESMCARIPLLEGRAGTGTLMSFGFDPEVACWSPFHGAQFAVLESVSRVVASGGRRADVRLTLQEYFPRVRNDAKRWGMPFAALLGALRAQMALETAAIGGKDSMSGSFGDMDVPPTLVSFAVAPVELKRVISPEFKQVNRKVWVVPVPLDEHCLPDWAVWREALDKVAEANARNQIAAAGVVRMGGIAACVSRMCFGNRIGIRMEECWKADELFQRGIGSLVLEWKGEGNCDLPGARLLGETIAAPQIQFRELQLDLKELQISWESTLEPVFPTRVPVDDGHIPHQLFEPHQRPRAKVRLARPKVVIPVFPGTNCEYETARVFAECGACPDVMVFRNRNQEDIRESIEALSRQLADAQMLMIPGGFSAGDEPDGSGKFIATVFRTPRLADSVMDLIRNRDGLVLGICNGFQALIKLGLIQSGEIRPQKPSDATLGRNHIGRHVSCYVRTKVVSKRSPWLSLCELGGEYWVPMSHGEGRLVGGEPVLQALFKNDQVATQYVDAYGFPTMRLPENPNGSMMAIEGLVSPCGRVFGKMGHSERFGKFVGMNLPGAKVQPVIASGVAYFRD